MNNLPKFIRIESYDGKIHYIKAARIERIVRCDEDKTIEFWMANNYVCFDEPDFENAKQAWLEYWMVLP